MTTGFERDRDEFARGARAVGPLGLGWVETAALGQIAERTGHRDAHALVAAQAKRLVPMAAGTFLLVFAGGHGVHAEPIIGVDLARSDSTIVAIGARLFAVTVGAEAAVVAGHDLVPFDPIRTVTRIV